MAVTFRPAGL